jgi:anti-sigma factor RsiW
MAYEAEHEELIALIDNELDESRRISLLARLETDAALRGRYEELRDSKASIGAAFDGLLAQAPLDRLRQAIPPETPVRPSPRRFGGFAWRDLAAGFVVGLLVAGAAAWFAFGLPGNDNWREAVVDYMSLYTDETFAIQTPDPQTQALELSEVGKRVGADLTPENVKLPGLEFKVAFILAYDGVPLGEIAYVDPTGAPVLFCVLAKDGPDAPPRAEKQDRFSLVSWSRQGRGFLVIGGFPEERIAGLARTLETRF